MATGKYPPSGGWTRLIPEKVIPTPNPKPAPPRDELVERIADMLRAHRRHVELSPGVGADRQRYALAVLDDVMSDAPKIAAAARAYFRERMPPRVHADAAFDDGWNQALTLVRERLGL